VDFDERLFRRLARAHSPVLDATLPRLGRAADYSRLWIAVAAVLYRAGGHRGRRAARRGLLSVAAASAVANGPVKLHVRRARPTHEVPLLRRSRRRHKTSSFPSGHSTSAAAFATGVALEWPAAGVPVAAAAAGVGLSRVWTGVHFPSDVLAGFAIGTGAGLLSARLWPVPRPEPYQAPARADVARAPGGRGVTFAVNPAAGPALSASPVPRLRELLPDAEVVEVDDAGQLDRALQEAARGNRVLGVAGGDGSVRAAAVVALAQGVPLAVVPGGTLNHFARDVGVTGVEDVAAAIVEGAAVQVRVGRIAGRTFVNTASFGAYAELVDARERLEPRIGKWAALAVALVQVLRRWQPVTVELDGRTERLWLVFLGNGRYQPDGLAPVARQRLDTGGIDVRLVRAGVPLGRLRLVLAAFFGRVHRCPAYRRLVVDELRVRAGEPLRLACDGETFDGPAEFTVESVAEPLAVFSPAASTSGR
jgi:undecaprenyl-diphosphatase